MVLLSDGWFGTDVFPLGSTLKSTWSVDEDEVSKI